MTKPDTPSFALLSMLIAGVFPAIARTGEVVDVYKTANCLCCGKWADHLRKAGFEVRTHNVLSLPAARKHFGVPDHVASCHSAKVAGYVVEGHVPVPDVLRLIKEKPEARGLAVPGMPIGSPGMEGRQVSHFNTLLIKHDGGTEVFAKH